MVLNVYFIIYLTLCSLRPSVRIFPGRKVENRFCTVLYRFLHLSPDTGWARWVYTVSSLAGWHKPFQHVGAMYMCTDSNGIEEWHILSCHWSTGTTWHGMASLAVLHKCIKEGVARTIFIYINKRKSSSVS